jgi:two-component system, cell cycle sensor histidine kinase and response regulator CckA
VLLVEDDPAIRNLAERTLRSNGLKVVAAASGEEALDIASSGQRFDVLVTDLMMPNMSGDELAERVTASHPDAKIVLMSGFSEDVLGETRMTRHRHFIEKPFTQQQLLQTVRAALRH